MLNNIFKIHADNITKAVVDLDNQEEVGSKKDVSNLVIAVCSAVLTMRAIGESLKGVEITPNAGADEIAKSLIKGVNAKMKATNPKTQKRGQ